MWFIKNRDYQKYCKTQGYTLVELMVTIVVITILATFLISALKIAQDKQKEIECQNNMLELTKAVYAYCAESNGKFPVGGYKGNQWRAETAEYVGLPPWDGTHLIKSSTGEKNGVEYDLDLFWHKDNDPVYRCPVVPDYEFSGWDQNRPGIGWNSGVNVWKQFRKYLMGRYEEERVAIPHILNPSEMITFGDTNDAHPRGRGESTIAAQLLPDFGGGDNWPPGMRHQGKANMAFADGHIESQTQEYWINNPEYYWNK